MTIYTTPLQFGYFFGLLFAALLFVRAKKKTSAIPIYYSE